MFHTFFPLSNLLCRSSLLSSYKCRKRGLTYSFLLKFFISSSPLNERLPKCVNIHLSKWRTDGKFERISRLVAVLCWKCSSKPSRPYTEAETFFAFFVLALSWLLATYKHNYRHSTFFIFINTVVVFISRENKIMRPLDF